MSKKNTARATQPNETIHQVTDVSAEWNLESQAVPPPKKTKAKATAARKPASRAKAGDEAKLIAYRHEGKRKNNPEVGMVDPDSDPDGGKTRWAYDPHLDPALQFDVTRAQIEQLIDDALASGDEAVMRDALAELKRRADPYLNWTGKAERTSFAVDTVSLYVHERIDPASILNALKKRVQKPSSSGPQADMFRAWFEDPLPWREAIEFYKHERGWANRLVAGDSLLVMNSLLQKESMRGQVQMIYIDPPYGIRYGSNFQPFVNKRDVKDRKDEDLTQEPEMIKAFRDTWELGIHSYLTYLRDRLLLAKELLADTGSVFVQISDENVHLVRELLDEVFGADHFIAQIVYRTTGGLGSGFLSGTYDLILWYGKDKAKTKFNVLYQSKEDTNVVDAYKHTSESKERIESKGGEYFITVSLVSSGYTQSCIYPFQYKNNAYEPKGGSWKTNQTGMARLAKAGRLSDNGTTMRYVYFKEDYPVSAYTNTWLDSGGAADKLYVVQTNHKIIERCLLMTTDPGDLVLDPTCGSGTTAVVAEKWGRRWITCDTSRVAVTLAKQRLLTASFDYYELKYPHEGLKSGFIYKTVPHVTLKSIANNPEIDEIYERLHPAIETALTQLNTALAKQPLKFKVTGGGRKGGTLDFAKGAALLEWEVPFDFPADWPASAQSAFDAFHGARQALQSAMDRSIASHADPETLYDQPQINKNKLRITGPFTVEAVPFPSVRALDESNPPLEADDSIARSGESARQHAWRDELLKTGIRGRASQMIRFAELETLPGTVYLHCSGTVAESGERVVVSFGPEYAALEQRQVEMAMREAGDLFPRPKMIVYCAFNFDPEAAKDIDATKGIVALKAQMNTDLLTEDLKKARASNQSFWLMGQPEVELRPRAGGRFEVEVHGFDYFDTVKGELVSGGKGRIAMWLLDTDYDERSLLPSQVFFPMAGAKDGWHKLRRDIKAELNEELLAQFHGTVSLPFEAGERRKVAVKIVDDRGIESLKVLALD